MSPTLDVSTTPKHLDLTREHESASVPCPLDVTQGQSNAKANGAEAARTLLLQIPHHVKAMFGTIGFVMVHRQWYPCLITNPSHGDEAVLAKWTTCFAKVSLVLQRILPAPLFQLTVVSSIG